MSSPFRFLSSLIITTLVILSEAKDLLFAGAARQQVLRFAQDDNFMDGVARAPIDPDPRHGMLSLNRKQERLLERLRDPAQKTRGVGAIYQPVIVRE